MRHASFIVDYGNMTGLSAHRSALVLAAPRCRYVITVWELTTQVRAPVLTEKASYLELLLTVEHVSCL